MPTLTLGTIDVPVAAGEIPKQWEDTATYRRRFTGAMDVEVRSTFGRARVWAVTTIAQTRAVADTLETQLLAAGVQTVSGDTVGSPSTTAYVQNIQRSERIADQVVLTFELHEVSGP